MVAPTTLGWWWGRGRCQRDFFPNNLAFRLCTTKGGGGGSTSNESFTPSGAAEGMCCCFAGVTSVCYLRRCCHLRKSICRSVSTSAVGFRRYNALARSVLLWRRGARARCFSDWSTRVGERGALCSRFRNASALGSTDSLVELWRLVRLAVGPSAFQRFARVAGDPF